MDLCAIHLLVYLGHQEVKGLVGIGQRINRIKNCIEADILSLDKFKNNSPVVSITINRLDENHFEMY
jgi:hypothetical protein